MSGHDQFVARRGSGKWDISDSHEISGNPYLSGDVLDTQLPYWRDALQDAPSLPSDRRLGLTSQNLAYIIYTSGSTGLPKGVMVEHRSVGRLFAATREWFGNHDVWALFHSFAFDFSVWEIWGALTHGGRPVVAPQLISRDWSSLTEQADRNMHQHVGAGHHELLGYPHAADIAAMIIDVAQETS